MRSNPLALAVSAFTLIAAASCGDDDNPPLNDAGPGMDAGVRDASVPVDTGTPPVDARIDGVAPTCAALGDVCTALSCCAPHVCVDRVLTSLCAVALNDGGMCSPEGSPCFLGTACCPGTVCVPARGSLMCAVEGGPDAAIMCGGLGADCNAMPCCPGLVCAPRGPGMFCLERG